MSKFYFQRKHQKRRHHRCILRIWKCVGTENFQVCAFSQFSVSFFFCSWKTQEIKRPMVNCESDVVIGLVVTIQNQTNALHNPGHHCTTFIYQKYTCTFSTQTCIHVLVYMQLIFACSTCMHEHVAHVYMCQYTCLTCTHVLVYMKHVYTCASMHVSPVYMCQYTCRLCSTCIHVLVYMQHIVQSLSMPCHS